MTENELKELVTKISTLKCETTDIEIKAAKEGTPTSLYDTLSSFSNTHGGTIIFGIDERDGYELVGVKDPQTLQKKVTEQCLSMEPPVYPLFTVAGVADRIVVSAEIPEMEAFLKPCYYKGKGKSKGSYIRVGESDLPMNDYEIHALEAYKFRMSDELRLLDNVESSSLSDALLDGYIAKLVTKKPNLSTLSKDDIAKSEGILDKEGHPTLCGMLNFGKLPQSYAPNLDILALRCATNEYGKEDANGIRFIDNKRIDGTLLSMFTDALAFVYKNTKQSTYINPNTGLREDKSEYPLKAIREIILNALMHRDYSRFTENCPIRIEIYDDRIEISNPGGLYGRLTLDELGKTRGDVRNPRIAGILEVMDAAENRYSGIPTIYEEMKKAGLLPPKFEVLRDTFKVTLFNAKMGNEASKKIFDEIVEKCQTPRSKEYLAKEFGFDGDHPSYFVNTYIKPLLEKGVLKYTIPNKPKSKNQKIVVA